MTSGRLIALLAGLVAAASAGVSLAASTDSGVIGPQNRLQPSGRRLAPVGHLTPLGNEPSGGALTPDGRFLWTLSAGRGRNDIRILALDPAGTCRRGRRGAACRRRAARLPARVIQTIPMPGVSGGMAMAPDGRTAYVSGVADSAHADQHAPAGTPGLGGDVIHVFHYDARSGVAQRAELIPVPPPADTAPVQDLPPGTTRLSWPRDLAVSRDGRTLLAALSLADRAAIIDTASHSVSYVKVGSYPWGAAITRDGKGLISNESDGTVSVIDLSSKTKVADVQVGPHLSHPEGVAVDPVASRAYAAVAGQDVIAVIDTANLSVERTLSVGRPQGIGTEPTDVSVSADGCRLMSSDSGEDAVAVFALRSRCTATTATPKRRRRRRAQRATAARRRHAPGSGGSLRSPGAPARPFELIGRVPVAAYPVFAAATPHRDRLVWISQKGLGVGPNPHGPNPLAPDDTDNRINDYRYLPSIVTGLAGVTPFPTDAQLRADMPAADAEVRPTNAELPPPGTPIAPNGKIKHVFYIVKENRTYDQVFGDDPRGDGDPKLELFPASLTPNQHALARRFPLLDHVYANSEASIDGHFWTSASVVDDHVVRGWQANYAARGYPYDFIYAVSWPPKGFLFDQAQRQGISYFNYGEAIAGVVPFPDKDRTPSDTAALAARYSHSDIGDPGTHSIVPPPPGTSCYPNDGSIGTDAITKQPTYDASLPAGAPPDALSRVDCFRQRFASQLATGSVPTFNYLVLPSDHTNGLSPGARTPQAMVADNDYAVGQMVDTISRSPLWSSSLILVVEDDSQDGADHVDAHRIPALAISPYARRGAVVHTRYDFPSFIRTLELAIGMSPLNLYDSLATPLYDAFDSTASNTEPYTAIAPQQDLNAKNANTAANRAASAGLDLVHTDRVPQHLFDSILWRAVHGMRSKPPPSGPNAVAGADN